MNIDEPFSTHGSNRTSVACLSIRETIILPLIPFVRRFLDIHDRRVIDWSHVSVTRYRGCSFSNERSVWLDTAKISQITKQLVRINYIFNVEAYWHPGGYLALSILWINSFSHAIAMHSHCEPSHAMPIMKSLIAKCHTRFIAAWWNKISIIDDERTSKGANCPENTAVKSRCISAYWIPKKA